MRYASSRHWSSRYHPINFNTPGCYVDKLHSKVFSLLPSSFLEDLLHLALRHVPVFMRLLLRGEASIVNIVNNVNVYTIVRCDEGVGAIGPIYPSARTSNRFERTVVEPKNRTSQILSKYRIMKNKRTPNKNILLIKIYNVCMSTFFGTPNKNIRLKSTMSACQNFSVQSIFDTMTLCLITIVVSVLFARININKIQWSTQNR
jgi:hypothetical protein